MVCGVSGSSALPHVSPIATGGQLSSAEGPPGHGYGAYLGVTTLLSRQFSTQHRGGGSVEIGGEKLDRLPRLTWPSTDDQHYCIALLINHQSSSRCRRFPFLTACLHACKPRSSRCSVQPPISGKVYRRRPTRSKASGTFCGTQSFIRSSLVVWFRYRSYHSSYTSSSSPSPFSRSSCSLQSFTDGARG